MSRLDLNKATFLAEQPTTEANVGTGHANEAANYIETGGFESNESLQHGKYLSHSNGKLHESGHNSHNPLHHEHNPNGHHPHGHAHHHTGAHSHHHSHLNSGNPQTTANGISLSNTSLVGKQESLLNLPSGMNNLGLNNNTAQALISSTSDLLSALKLPSILLELTAFVYFITGIAVKDDAAFCDKLKKDLFLPNYNNSNPNANSPNNPDEKVILDYLDHLNEVESSEDEVGKKLKSQSVKGEEEIIQDIKKAYLYLYDGLSTVISDPTLLNKSKDEETSAKIPLQQEKGGEWAHHISKVLFILSDKRIDSFLREHISFLNINLNLLNSNNPTNNPNNSDDPNQSNILKLSSVPTKTTSMFTLNSIIDAASDHPGSRNICWKLFEFCQSIAGVMPNHATIYRLAQRFEESQEHERSITLLEEGIEWQSWDFYATKMYIRLMVEKSPSDLEEAVSILNQYMARTEKDQERLLINLSNPLLSYHNEPSVSLEDGKRALSLYFLGLSRQYKWNECKRLYEESKIVGSSPTIESSNNAGSNALASPSTVQTALTSSASHSTSPFSSHLAMDNAMIDICSSYGQFEYAWSIYEHMKVMDRNTFFSMARLCHLAFFQSQSSFKKESSANNGESSTIDNASSTPHSPTQSSPPPQDSMILWEARAWAFYGKFLHQDEREIMHSVVFVVHQLLEIAAGSIEPSSRLGKAIRIYNQLKGCSVYEVIIHDDYLFTPLLRLCLKGVKEAISNKSNNNAASSNSNSAQFNFLVSNLNANEYFETAIKVYGDLRKFKNRISASNSNYQYGNGQNQRRISVSNNPNSTNSSGINSAMSSPGASPSPTLSPMRLLHRSNSSRRYSSVGVPLPGGGQASQGQQLSTGIPSLVSSDNNIHNNNNHERSGADSSNANNANANSANNNINNSLSASNNSSSSTSIIVFDTRSMVRPCSAIVYSILLELCLLMKDPTTFNLLCRDMVVTAIDITTMLAKSLQHGHDSLLPDVCKKGSSATNTSATNSASAACTFQKLLDPFFLFTSSNSKNQSHNNNANGSNESYAASSSIAALSDEAYEEGIVDRFLLEKELQKRAKDLLVHCCGNYSIVNSKE